MPFTIRLNPLGRKLLVNVMKKSSVYYRFVLLVFGVLLFAGSAHAQCDTIATLCGQHIDGDFISDGQQYRALLLNDEVAEFHATFFGGTTYRVAACSGLSDGNLIFRLFDSERNLLFTNAEFSNSAYWDFQIKSTLDCIIEAQLDQSAGGSGGAVLSIGFTQD